MVVPIHVETAWRFFGLGLADVDCHKPDAAFNQPPPQHVALAAMASSVAVASPVVFLFEPKRALRQRVGQEIGGLARQVRECANGILFRRCHSDVEIAEQVSSIQKTLTIDACQQAKVVDLPARIGQIPAACLEDLRTGRKKTNAGFLRLL